MDTDLEPELYEEKVKSFRQERYDYLRWSTEENLYRNERKYKEDIFYQYSFPFSVAIRIKLRNSLFGKYVDTFNPNQDQDKILNENKLAITEWDIKKLKPNEKLKFETQNSIIQNYFDILKYAVEQCDLINLHCIQKKIQKLTVINFYINLIDADLRNFFNVRILVLSGNNLRTIEGSILPRKLAFLELFNNFISNVKDLVTNAPKTISHLGLSRNKLDDNSLLHLIVSSGNFKILKVLDLSCNDICDLESTTSGLAGLDSLKSLSLQDNPCAVIPTYKGTVLCCLPSLIFLDDTQVLKRDKAASTDSDESKKDLKPQLVFFCHRIMGLPKPPKDKKFKKAVQTIHLEIELPLLEAIHFPEPVDPEKEEDDKKGSKKTSKKSEEKSSKSSKKSGKKKSPYEMPDEYDPLAEQNDFSYKSVKKAWNKTIQYPPVLIPSPEENLVCIRDTFRSIVNVRVVYLKILPAKAQKKPKKEKKPKKKDKDKKKDKKKGGKDDKSKPAEKQKPAAPQDITLKRVTIGNFYCDLRSVNWSDETVDFYWTDHPKIGLNALYMDGCLKALKYTDKLPKKKPPKKGKGGTEVSVIEEDPATIKNLFPKILTCQVGFGLKRSFTV